MNIDQIFFDLNRFYKKIMEISFEWYPGMIFEESKFKISIPSIQSLDHSPFCHISDCFGFQFLALLVFVEQ